MTEPKQMYYLFDNIQYDGGELEAFPTLEEAKKHITSDSEKIIRGVIVWDASEPKSFPGVLRIGKFYKTREGHKALYCWKGEYPTKDYLSKEENEMVRWMLCFVDQEGGKLIRTFQNGREFRLQESKDDIIGEWEGE